MRRSKRPVIRTKCVAAAYALTHEVIAEVSFPSGAGCLISFRQNSLDGRDYIQVYRADKNIVVTGPDDSFTSQPFPLESEVSLLIRTCWDTLQHMKVDGQWEALNEAASGAAKALDRERRRHLTLKESSKPAV